MPEITGFLEPELPYSVEPYDGDATRKSGELVVERTTPQVFTQPGTLANAELYDQMRRYYREYRAMRTDPTIAFARMMCIAPLINAGWSYKASKKAPSEAKEMIEEIFEPKRIRLTKTALEGYMDFGWMPYEMVKGVREKDGFITVNKFKPLIQFFTWILVDRNKGDYVGLRQQLAVMQVVDLSVYDSLLLTFDVEGTNYYGFALMENARLAYDAWNNVEAASLRYDTKIAGSFIVVHYPIGNSPYNGSMMDNFDIAKAIVTAIESSGKIIVPRKIEQFIEEMNATLQKGEDVWKIELLTDNGSARAQFIERAKYLDSLKVRAFGFPERAVLEGQFGTKAESATQADFAILNIDVRHLLITQQINQQAVDLLLELNWGPESRGTVCIEPNPITDDKVDFYRKAYLMLLRNRDIAPTEFGNTDMITLRERMDLPQIDDDDQETEIKILPTTTRTLDQNKNGIQSDGNDFRDRSASPMPPNEKD